jgi:glycerophosphoryl diester phosphodiesterase
MSEGGSLLEPDLGGSRRVICCHRSTLSGRFLPNSLAAIEECLSARVPRFEFDVWVLSDGACLLFHDTVLDAETDGRGPVALLRRREAAALRYHDGATPLAFLEQVVEMAEGTSTLLQVDLKGLAPIPLRHLEGLARVLEPVASHTIIGSQAHWNLRPLGAMGFDIAFDTTLQWHALERTDGDGLSPSRRGIHGLWDDSVLAHVPGVSPAEYIDARVDDLLGLLAAAEWMVDWRTLFHLQDLGCDLGLHLQRRGVALAAWTLRDEGEAETAAKAARLFALGAQTVIAQAPARLGQYLRAG